MQLLSTSIITCKPMLQNIEEFVRQNHKNIEEKDESMKCGYT